MYPIISIKNFWPKGEIETIKRVQVSFPGAKYNDEVAEVPTLHLEDPPRMQTFSKPSYLSSEHSEKPFLINTTSLMQANTTPSVVYKKAYDTGRAGRILIRHQPVNKITKIQIIGCINVQ